MIDTAENFYFRAARAYFYRGVLDYPFLGLLSRKWDAVEYPNGEMRITRLSDGTSLCMTKTRGIQFLCEYEADRKWYVEGVPLAGMTVLEGGSGCGETQLLMRDAGASKVFAVDSNPDCSRLHWQNAERLGWTAGIINESFSLEHLHIPHDYCKLDIEGGEEVLLESEATPELLGPARIELHPQKIGEEKCLAIVKKFDLLRIGSKGRHLRTENKVRNGDTWSTRGIFSGY